MIIGTIYILWLNSFEHCKESQVQRKARPVWIFSNFCQLISIKFDMMLKLSTLNTFLDENFVEKNPNQTHTHTKRPGWEGIAVSDVWETKLNVDSHVLMFLIFQTCYDDCHVTQ